MSKPRIILHSLPFILLIVLAVPIVGMAWIEGSKALGLRSLPVPVVGTGSMYPSLFWSKEEGGPEDESQKVIEEYRASPHLYRRFNGLSILGKTYLRSTLNHGDMVAFKNARTAAILKEADKDGSNGFIKRIIGVPGDTLELRDGFVYRNSIILSEPYIYNPRSTYGGTTIKDCQKLTIPEGHYFVLGDNRKVSADSRADLGLIAQDDIEFVLPYAQQKLYQPLWRDTQKDASLMGQPTLDGDEFVTLINRVRRDKQLPPLSLKSALVKSSASRGAHLLANPKTDFGMKQAISGANYSNIILGEFVSHGHFSAQELLENLLFNQGTAKQILSRDYTDIGLSAVTKEIDGCPTQIIVGHLGGYIPATYDQTTLESWRSLRDNLANILPSWEKARDYPQINQAKLEELLTILRRRLSLAEEILATMEKSAWLSDSQESRIKHDETDANQAETLAQELNKQ